MDALPLPEAPIMTVAEFLVWEPGDGRRWQLVDGTPRPMAVANRTHGALHSEIAAVIVNYLVAQESPCCMLAFPGVQPSVNAICNFRIPDHALTCTSYDDEEFILRDPVLLIEILSQDDQDETWSNVEAYTTIPSMQEILVLHTATVAADIIRRGPDGLWLDAPVRIVDGDLLLDSIGFRVPLRQVYRTTRLA